MRCAKNEDERLRGRELYLRWPDGTTVVGSRQELLQLLDAICCHDVNEREFAEAEAAKVAVAWLPSGRNGGAHDEDA